MFTEWLFHLSLSLQLMTSVITVIMLPAVYMVWQRLYKQLILFLFVFMRHFFYSWRIRLWRTFYEVLFERCQNLYCGRSMAYIFELWWFRFKRGGAAASKSPWRYLVFAETIRFKMCPIMWSVLRCVHGLCQTGCSPGFQGQLCKESMILWVKENIHGSS